MKAPNSHLSLNFTFGKTVKINPSGLSNERVKSIKVFLLIISLLIGGILYVLIGIARAIQATEEARG